MYNADEPRDLIMPALALDNYSHLDDDDYYDGFMMLWAPKELAAFADRNLINNPDQSNLDIYCWKGVHQDSAHNSVEHTYYTFNNATTDASDSTDLQNKLIVTQPEKRTAVQIGLGLEFWQKGLCEVAGNTSGAEISGDLANGSKWGLVYGASIWDEAEALDTIDQDPEVSPGGTAAKAVLCPEVGEIANIEADSEMADKNGYVAVRFQKAAPAIITQMTASRVGDERRINWHSIAADINQIEEPAVTPEPK